MEYTLTSCPIFWDHLTAGDATFTLRLAAGTLAHFHIGDTTAGQMLVDEELAKVWEGRRAEWCG